MRQQNFYYSVSFLNISNTLIMLLRCSWWDDATIKAEVTKTSLKEEDLLRKALVCDEVSHSSSSPPQSPALP
jgi:hypothetical protein